MERLLTDRFTLSAVEHLHRYALAADICHGMEVLDIASGEGYGSNLLSRKARRVIGVDLSKDATEQAKAKYSHPNLSYIQGAAEAIPLDDASVDAVVSFETLEHHDKHEEMLAEIKRVLRPDGVLIISTPDKLFYSDIPQYTNEFHVRELYLDEFRALIQRHFHRHRLLSQGPTFGTIIAPGDDWGSFSYYGGDFQTCDSVQRLTHTEYNIGIASDGDLPEVGVSFFDGYLALEEYRRQVEKRERRVPHLEKRLRNREQFIHELQNSVSYRLGRSLTWPLRKLFGSDPG
jgi:ubiquinone/menaquinone biosynthesis C-methylase UbiE